MFERLNKIENRYNEINKELTDPSIVSDVKKMTSLSKEQASLKDAYDLLGKVIGKTYDDDLLYELFSRFCLGK